MLGHGAFAISFRSELAGIGVTDYLGTQYVQV